jgi:hypothetical protein
MKFQSQPIRGTLLVLLLALVGLACSRSGEILTDAQATVANLPTPTAVIDVADDATYQVGDSVTIVGGSAGFLVPLYGEPGARFFSSQINNGETAVVIEHGLDEDETIWYLVEGLAGTGWLTEEFLTALVSE